jgi:hypothetical protein
MKITENFTLILCLLLSGWHHKLNVSKTGTSYYETTVELHLSGLIGMMGPSEYAEKPNN